MYAAVITGAGPMSCRHMSYVINTLSGMKRIFYLFLCLSLSSILSFGQEADLTPDDLFLRARQQAFDEKDYAQAIRLAKQALQQAPDYTDVRIFLGRVYTWSGHIDSARTVFKELSQANVKDEDFFLAYASTEYWNKQPDTAAAIVDKGLALHPASQDLLLLKANISYSNSQYEATEQAVNKILQINPKHTEARALSKNIQEYLTRNAVGLTYNFVYFDKQFDDNWHIVGLSYRRTTPVGPVIFRANYGNKFAQNGMQFELEAYPRLSRMFYLYVGGSYADNRTIFPKYRTGVSLYANLPQSFEAEVGYRQLHFTNSIWMYTASVGKYYQNFWFNFRTYLTPNQEDIAHSYTATARYYTKGINDYVGFVIGTGLTPEENRNNLLDITPYKLKTFRVGGEYNFSVRRTNIISIATTYYNQEFRPGEKGNQLDIILGYIKAF